MLPWAALKNRFNTWGDEALTPIPSDANVFNPSSTTFVIPASDVATIPDTLTGMVGTSDVDDKGNSREPVWLVNAPTTALMERAARVLAFTVSVSCLTIPCSNGTSWYNDTNLWVVLGRTMGEEGEERGGSTNGEKRALAKGATVPLS